MTTREYTTVDKSSWPRGEWDGEPDKIQWRDEATGLPCLIVRSPLGALCGYVGVTNAHAWHGKDYSDAIGTCSDDCSDGYHYGHAIDSLIRVHGGLTFSDRCSPGEDESRGICHVPEPGEPDHVWWFGFDCGHHRDLVPGVDAGYRSYDGCYKNISYVRREVTLLAAQLMAVRS